ncbi:RteC domain-containing protein [Bacteroidota bacterium]
MKNILLIIDSYADRKKKVALNFSDNHEILKEKIKLTQSLLQELRLYVRSNSFKTKEDEIYFFKYIKPKICGDMKSYSCQVSFYIEKPNATICVQQAHIKAALKKLESKKKKNIVFYKYLKNSETLLDDKYFFRNNGQFNLFGSDSVLCSDPEFNTSHDMLAAEVVAYDLLTRFYMKELEVIKNENESCPDAKKNKKLNSSDLLWTSSKADLIELIYALKASGSINGGDSHIKQLTDVFGSMFNIDLGNYYKTYADIKNRNKDQTKFLMKLTSKLAERLELEDA